MGLPFLGLALFLIGVMAGACVSPTIAPTFIPTALPTPTPVPTAAPVAPPLATFLPPPTLAPAPTPEPKATASPTPVPRPSPTPSPLPTPLSVPGKGILLFSDDFLRNKGWVAKTDPDGSRYFYQNSAYHMANNTQGFLKLAAAPLLSVQAIPLPLKDFAVEVELRRLSGPGDAYDGIYMETTSVTKLYFLVNGQGRVKLWKRTSGDQLSYFLDDFAPMLKQERQKNTIRLVRQSGLFAVFINDQLFGTTGADMACDEPVYKAGVTAGEGEVAFSWFALYKDPPSLPAARPLPTPVPISVSAATRTAIGKDIQALVTKRTQITSYTQIRNIVETLYQDLTGEAVPSGILVEIHTLEDFSRRFPEAQTKRYVGFAQVSRLAGYQMEIHATEGELYHVLHTMMHEYGHVRHRVKNRSGFTRATGERAEAVAYSFSRAAIQKLIEGYGYGAYYQPSRATRNLALVDSVLVETNGDFMGGEDSDHSGGLFLVWAEAWRDPDMRRQLQARGNLDSKTALALHQRLIDASSVLSLDEVKQFGQQELKTIVKIVEGRLVGTQFLDAHQRMLAEWDFYLP